MRRTFSRAGNPDPSGSKATRRASFSSVVSGDSVDWEDRPEPADGGPVKVWVAIEMLKLSEIDNVKSTAQIQLDVNLVRAPCTASAVATVAPFSLR